MIFSKFSKPKWQHRDSDVRLAAIEEIDDSTILNEIVQHDDTVAVRKAAVLKINDLKLLDHIAQHDTDSDLRDIAEQRFKYFLCDNSLNIEKRLQWLENTHNADRISYVAIHEKNIEMRKKAIAKVAQEEVLGEIAIHDPLNEIRLSTIEKISQKSILERVIKVARNSDKRLTRCAREKLKTVIEQQERPARIQAECDTICTKMHTLEERLNAATSYKSKTLKQENVEFKRLQERYQEIVVFTSPQCQNSWTTLQHTIVAALEKYQHALKTEEEREQSLIPIRAAKKVLCEQMEHLLIDITQQHTFTNEEEQGYTQQLQSLENQWAEQPAIEALEQQWHVASQAVKKQQQHLQNARQQAHTLKTLCQKAETLLKKNTSLKPEQLKKLQARWKEVLHASTQCDDLQNRFDNSVKILTNRLQEQDAQRQQAIPELKTVLSELEKSLEEGVLQTANTLEQKAQNLIKNIGTVSMAAQKTLERRLQACHAKINELQSWQRWGNKLEREKLCEQVENILETEDDNPTTLVRMIQEVQTAWEKMGSSGYSRPIWDRFNKTCHAAFQRYREHLCLQMEYLSEQASTNPEAAAKMIRQAQNTWKEQGSQGHSQALWERFNTACQTAYVPCRTHFHLQAKERHQNFSEKKSLCEHLENFAKETDWETADWKEVYQCVRETDKSWRLLGTTDRKLRKGIQERFQAALYVLEKHLDVERHKNCRYRINLMGQVDEITHILHEVINTQNPQKLIDNKITETIETVKKLQEQWHVTVPGNRRIEHEFWKIFRSSCDVVFDYRKQQQERHKKTFQSYLNEKIALCEKIEILATSTGEAIKTALPQLQALKIEWKALKIDLNQLGSLHKKVRAVEERFIKACQKVGKQYQGQLATVRREQLETLKLKSDFCVEIEQSEHQNEPEWIVQKQTDWEAIPPLENADIDAVITQRFQQACTATSPNDDVVSTKETLCIRMEILAGIDSPPEAAKTRLAYQVNRLSAAMSRGEKESPDPQMESEKIEQTWYLNGTAKNDKIASLEQRFSKACKVFFAQSTT